MRNMVQVINVERTESDNNVGSWLRSNREAVRLRRLLAFQTLFSQAPGRTGIGSPPKRNPQVR